MGNKLLTSLGLAAALATTLTAHARQLPSSTVAGGNSSGAFFGGFIPTNIVNKPINVSGAAMPLNMQQAMMPQQQSTKVFNVNSAFRNVGMPLFRSTAPSVPVVQSGKSNPIQPTNPIQLNPIKVQPSPVPPYYK
jgi:hypothetical protein